MALLTELQNQNWQILEDLQSQASLCLLPGISWCPPAAAQWPPRSSWHEFGFSHKSKREKDFSPKEVKWLAQKTGCCCDERSETKAVAKTQHGVWERKEEVEIFFLLTTHLLKIIHNSRVNSRDSLLTWVLLEWEAHLSRVAVKLSTTLLENVLTIVTKNHLYVYTGWYVYSAVYIDLILMMVLCTWKWKLHKHPLLYKYYLVDYSVINRARPAK